MELVYYEHIEGRWNSLLGDEDEERMRRDLPKVHGQFIVHIIGI
jgi:hypothetical protein